MQGGADRVLVLERAADAGVGIESMLATAGYETRAAADHLTSLRIVDEWRPSAVVVDLRVPDRQGYQLGAALAQLPETEDVPFIFVGEVPNLLKEMTVVPVGLVPTPVDHDLLVAAVSRALRREKVAP
jgi:DNA-binding response OmpR family regulator